MDRPQGKPCSDNDILEKKFIHVALSCFNVISGIKGREREESVTFGPAA